MMLVLLFKLNTIVSICFGLTFFLMYDFYFTRLGLAAASDDDSDSDADVRAVSFLWGAGIQPFLAWTQYNIATYSNTEQQLIVHGRTHFVWWVSFGIIFFWQIPNATTDPIAVGTAIFCIVYGLIYGYYSYIDIPTNTIHRSSSSSTGRESSANKKSE